MTLCNSQANHYFLSDHLPSPPPPLHKNHALVRAGGQVQLVKQVMRTSSKICICGSWDPPFWQSSETLAQQVTCKKLQSKVIPSRPLGKPNPKYISMVSIKAHYRNYGMCWTERTAICWVRLCWQEKDNCWAKLNESKVRTERSKLGRASGQLLW